MALLREIHLSHLPPDLAVFVAQYRDVENASFLRDQLLAGNAEFEYAFLDASMVCSPGLGAFLSSISLDPFYISCSCGSVQSHQ